MVVSLGGRGAWQRLRLDPDLGCPKNGCRSTAGDGSSTGDLSALDIRALQDVVHSRAVSGGAAWWGRGSHFWKPSLRRGVVIGNGS